MFLKHIFYFTFNDVSFSSINNVKIERFVQVFKRNIKFHNTDYKNIETEIIRFILSYRSALHLITEISPSQWLMNTHLRKELVLMLHDFQNQNNVFVMEEFTKKIHLNIWDLWSFATCRRREYITPTKSGNQSEIKYEKKWQ